MARTAPELTHNTPNFYTTSTGPRTRIYDSTKTTPDRSSRDYEHSATTAKCGNRIRNEIGSVFLESTRKFRFLSDSKNSETDYDQINF
ncbi:hypothetical protein TNCV_1262241 [Trichonephila clavipes]|nr:hypothetical protein TNCV_1262241 [Trichonephila clavipes]